MITLFRERSGADGVAPSPANFLELRYGEVRRKPFHALGWISLRRMHRAF
jgi:hypothetical protein